MRLVMLQSSIPLKITSLKGEYSSSALVESHRGLGTGAGLVGTERTEDIVASVVRSVRL